MAYASRLGDLLRRWRSLIHVARPCLVCQQRAWNHGVCEQCLSELATERRQGIRCQTCCLPLPQYGGCINCAQRPLTVRKVFVAWDYRHTAKILMHAYKNQLQHDLASVMAQVLYHEVIAQWIDRPSQFWVTAIPASQPALLRRGFNPAGEVARRVAKNLGQAYSPRLLYSVGAQDGVAQKQRTRRQRLAADAPTWQCMALPVGSTVLVVDDVLTTGSTLQHAAKLCKRAGASHVYAAVVARTPWHDCS